MNAGSRADAARLSTPACSRSESNRSRTRFRAEDPFHQLGRQSESDDYDQPDENAGDGRDDGCLKIAEALEQLLLHGSV